MINEIVQKQELINYGFMDRPKLVQSLDSVCTYTEMLLNIVLGDTFIDYRYSPVMQMAK